MRSAKLYFLIVTILALNFLRGPLIFAEEEGENFEQLKTASNQFDLNVKMAEEKYGLVFVLSREDQPQDQMTYDLFYFFEGRLQDSQKGIRLPYEFRQTFRGFPSGSYQVRFILKSSSGEVSSVSTQVSGGK